MATFSESPQWVSVTKPANTDFNIAEKSTFVFSTTHPFLVGEYLTNSTTGSGGLVYELLSTTSLNVARDSATLFPSTGTLGNGSATVSYTSVTTTHGISNELVQNLVDRTKFLNDNKTTNTITITAGTGLTGGGDLSANRTITLGTPSSLSGSTTNAITGTTHTHAISVANETASGLVELATAAETTTGTDTTRAVHPAGLKVELDKKTNKTTTITAGTGMTGGGDLSTNRTITLGTPSTLTEYTGNTISGTTHTHAVSIASETTKGLVELATAAETTTGTASTIAVHPAGLKVELDKKTNKTTTIIAGLGLTDGGDLSGNVTVSLGTPSTLNGSTTNSLTNTTHTHAISAATETLKGVVELATAAETTTGTDTTRAVTPAGLKVELDKKALNTITISAGTGMTGGGDLSTNRTITLGTPSTLDGSTTNSATLSTHTHAISAATTLAKGLMQIADSSVTLSGTSYDRALTPGYFAAHSLISQNGFYKFPGGMIIQWGRVYSKAAGNATITFGIGFPTACFTVLTTVIYATEYDENACVSSITSTSFKIWSSNSGLDYYWIAIGH